MQFEIKPEPPPNLPRRKLVDVILLIAALLAAGLVALEVDLFVNADHRSSEKVRLETNEALLLGTLLSVGLLIFSIRRFNEQKRELKLRIEAEMPESCTPRSRR